MLTRGTRPQGSSASALNEQMDALEADVSAKLKTPTTPRVKLPSSKVREHSPACKHLLYLLCLCLLYVGSGRDEWELVLI